MVVILFLTLWLMASPALASQSCPANTVPVGNGVQIDPTCKKVPDVAINDAYSGVGACSVNNWASTLNRDAAPTCTQPGFSNLSGSVACSQLPALTGDTTSSSGSCGTTTLKSNGNLFTSTTFGASLNLSTLMSGDCTIAAGGALTCTKSNGNLFTSTTFGASLNLSTLMSGGATISASGVVTLANPSASTLGGIESLAAVSSKWINTISTSGVPSATQPAFTDISGTSAASQGGTGTAYGEPACGEGGTIASAGTVTPVFTNTNCYHFTTASGSAGFSLANPTNPPSHGFVYIGWSQAAAGYPGITWGTHYLGYNVNDDKIETLSTDSTYTNLVGYVNNTSGVAWLPFWSDGTNLTLLPGVGTQVTTAVTKTTDLIVGAATGGKILGAANAAGGYYVNNVKMPAALPNDLAFGTGALSTLPSSTSLYNPVLVVNGGTLQNGQINFAGSLTCATFPTVKLLDCGTTIPTTCAGPTVLETGTLVAANATLAMTVNSSTLTATHWLAWEVTAGTCAAVSGGFTGSAVAL